MASKNIKLFYCELCDKNYKSYQSLWNHNKKFHPKCSKVLQNGSKNAPKTPVLVSKNASDNQQSICEFCNKQFSKKSNLTKHLNLNRCKVKKNEMNILKKENEEIKKEIKELKNQMMDLMNKTYKMHPKTLQKINNQLNNCTITNTINIVQLGKEDIVNTLSKKEKLSILNKCYGSFNKLIEDVHFNNKYPQFKNIAITNLKDDYAYKYNEEENKFIACKKEELLEDLLDNRTIDLEDILNENVELINNVQVSKIKELIDKLYGKEDLYDENKSSIKLMIYNKSDKEKLKKMINI